MKKFLWAGMPRLARSTETLMATALLVLAILLSGIAPAHAATPGVNADVTVRVQGSYTGTTTSSGTPGLTFDVYKLTQLTAGTGTGFADKLILSDRTLAASATENLDLAGVLLDPLGAAVTCVKVKSMTFIAAAGNTNNVVVGGAASNGFIGPFGDVTDKITLRPGAAWTVTEPGAGWTVTPATGDLILVANSSSGTSVTYTVAITCATA